MLFGDNLDQLAQASDITMAALKGVPGLVDLNSSYRPGKPEIQVVMDPNRMKRLGVNGVTAGQELRGQIDGTVAAQFRDGDLDYDIRVRLKEGQRDLRQGLGRFWVPNMNQNLVRLSDIATAKPASGPLSISPQAPGDHQRRDRPGLRPGQRPGKGHPGHEGAQTARRRAIHLHRPGRGHEGHVRQHAGGHGLGRAAHLPHPGQPV
jgi:HAE1 family hydrophobic/amphiphilic exporter-1